MYNLRKCINDLNELNRIWVNMKCEQVNYLLQRWIALKTTHTAAQWTVDGALTVSV